MRYCFISLFLILSYTTWSQKQYGNIFCPIPCEAVLLGKDNDLKRYIVAHFIQPVSVPDSSFTISGQIRFVVFKNGKVGNFEILKKAGYKCDEEIIRILQLTRWKPARYNGKTVAGYFSQPYTIIFEKEYCDNIDALVKR